MKKAPSKNKLCWDHEYNARRKKFNAIAGLDEAGRGCLAGPVVAATVIFHEHDTWPDALNDSKKLTRSNRQDLFDEIISVDNISYAIASASVDEVDALNVLHASFLAMRRAWQKLHTPPDFALIDGNRLPMREHWPFEAKAIVKGDGISPSIAAASILAKESRDRMMEKLDQKYPGYHFAKHKGYGTKEHLAALQKLGPCTEHRKSFAPVRQTTLPGFS
ncbi:MAG: ribonuclease HII [Verrucomicrobiota bacterium]